MLETIQAALGLSAAYRPAVILEILGQLRRKSNLLGSVSVYSSEAERCSAIISPTVKWLATFGEAILMTLPSWSESINPSPMGWPSAWWVISLLLRTSARTPLLPPTVTLDGCAT